VKEEQGFQLEQGIPSKGSCSCMIFIRIWCIVVWHDWMHENFFRPCWFSKVSWFLPRNRLAVMHVPPTTQLVWPSFRDSGMNCLAVT